MSKYYRVIKENFLWEEGAILVDSTTASSVRAYLPIEDVWDKTDHQSSECITAPIVENSPEWFERVYKNRADKFISKAKAKVEFGSVTK